MEVGYVDGVDWSRYFSAAEDLYFVGIESAKEINS